MLSINGPEFLVLVIIALVVIGPERLPHYAQQLGRAVRELRKMAQGARAQVKAELGDEFDDLDWQKLDPRQYDPRRIVKEALSDVWDDDEPAGGPGATTRPPGSAVAKKRASNGSSTRKPANPSQRSSAAPRKRTTPALEKAGASAAGAAVVAGASVAAAGATGSPPDAESADLTKPAGRPGARPGGAASRPGDTDGPAPFDLEAT